MPTLDDFAGLCGERFALQDPAGGHVSAELVKAEAVGNTPINGRQPFSLIFVGPPTPILPQRTYRVGHERFSEELDIFLVPIGADAVGVRYQAIFS